MALPTVHDLTSPSVPDRAETRPENQTTPRPRRLNAYDSVLFSRLSAVWLGFPGAFWRGLGRARLRSNEIVNAGQRDRSNSRVIGDPAPGGRILGGARSRATCKTAHLVRAR
jgi:hypothetical protein